jgi:cytochrome c oxidase assembly protein subunit 11
MVRVTSVSDQTTGASVDHAARGRFNRRTLGKLLVLAVLMFGFGFAMVPLYRAICEVTGVNLLTRPDPTVLNRARASHIDATRTVVVELDANGRGPWHFKPERASVVVRPGELVKVEYELFNSLNRAVSGQAIPSYAPSPAVRYFQKLECFCFAQQVLQGLESRRFPVVFMIDPALPSEITTITLSYTFFEVGASDAPAAQGG